MSRVVDSSDLTALSEEDLAYLETRGQVHMEHAVSAERKRRAKMVAGEHPVIEEVDLPYDKWKPEELKTELKARGLSTEGKKPDLVARLEEHDARSE